MQSCKKLNHYAWALAASLITTQATASTGGAGMPWEGPLQMIQTSMTGPVAFGLGVITLVISGAALMWGEELGGMVRKLINTVFAIGIAVTASPLLTKLFGVSGALF